MGSATQAQLLNNDVINCIWFMKESFYTLSLDYADLDIIVQLNQQTEVCLTLYSCAFCSI
jgi:hypothetical protein